MMGKINQKDFRHVNMQSKNIREFTPKDTIYVTKMVQGHMATYYCQFVELRRGMVVATVKDIENEHWCAIPIGDEIRARVTKCYLWGRKEKDTMEWDHCNWFKPSGYAG